MYIPDIFQETHYVFDGGSLLQRLPWTFGVTFDEICQSFKHYLLNNYVTVENITVVFSYLLPSTKGSKHIRQSKGRLGRKIVPSLHNPLNVKNGNFPVHKHSKGAFLEMLGTQLSASSINVMHSDEDADVDIVSSVLTDANTCPVALLGEDTDLLILLLWHYNPQLHNPVHFYSNSSKTAVDIKKSKQLLGDKLTQSNLAIHTFCGCNATSRLHFVGSRGVFQNFLKNEEFRDLLRIFSLVSGRKDILQAGEKILLLLLGGKREKTLDEFRVHKFHDKMLGQT